MGIYSFVVKADVKDSTSGNTRAGLVISSKETLFITLPIKITLKYDDDEWDFVNQVHTITPFVSNQPVGTTLRFKTAPPVLVSGMGPLVVSINAANGDISFQSTQAGDHTILVTCEAVDAGGNVK